MYSERSEPGNNRTSGFDWGASLAPVKNTFIHYDISKWSLATEFQRRGCSSPAVLVENHVSGNVPEEGLVQVCPRYGLPHPDVPEEMPPTFGGEGFGRAAASSSSTLPSTTAQDQQPVERVSSESSAGWRRPLQRHEEGNCKPCVYFHIKEDGCRLAEKCEFCHICSREDVKDKKRLLKRRSRAARREAKKSEEEEAYLTEDEGMWQDSLRGWQDRPGALVFGTGPASAPSTAGSASP